MSPPAFDVRKVHKRFPSGFELCIEDLQLGAGRITALIGPNGSGKSTLLRLLSGLDAPDEGEIRVFGQALFSGRRGLSLRRRIVLVGQKTTLFRGSVLRNALYGSKVRSIPRGEALARAGAALAALGLGGLAERPARELSGGEAQRVALARALCLDVDAFLLDEPTAHIDRASVACAEACLKDLNARKKATILFTTHDEEQARRLTADFLYLCEGRLCSASPPAAASK
ncbi:MAG: ATP-binding cassette domain-containing protein [Planctomycetes bacterium]|nr:ATP-binding cassette domain-containing protein [Planctomycetota bacterium]